ncbi:MAG: L-lactate dehydrogenase [Bacillota bacterium]|nr:L-lactate dehydrogenase [Bacillota bacterium]
MSKVAIIGTGFVGASIAFAMSIKNMANEIVLIDVNKQKALGEAMDISHGLPFIGQMSVYSGDYEDCADCDVIVITAGANRKPGETRLDLARKNVSIAKDITENIMKHYTKGVIVVVSNPVDILTYMIQKWSGLPNGKVLGTGTVLDSSRFRYLIGSKLNVDVKNVHGYIIGEHGDSQLPAWSATHIAGKNIEEYCLIPNSGFTQADKAEIAEEVKKAGAEIIKNKGATYYAIAITVNTIVETILKNQNTIRTVSSVIDGYMGIHDVTISLPSTVGADGVTNVLDLKLTAEEQALLLNSAEQVNLILKEVKSI